MTEPRDDADGHRLLMHLVESAVAMQFELDPDRPVWRRIVTPTRKALGDNPDAIYFEAAVNPKHDVPRHRQPRRGRLHVVHRRGRRGRGQVLDADRGRDQRHPDRRRARRQLRDLLRRRRRATATGSALPDDAAALITRHYFEEPEPAAADPNLRDPAHDRARSNRSGRRRRGTTTRSRPASSASPPTCAGRTVDQPPRGSVPLPSWVGMVPNVFPQPEKPGEMAFSAFDAAYSVAPYALGPDEALVITGRWPECVFANVSIWNRFLQTYDYVNRRVVAEPLQHGPRARRQLADGARPPRPGRPQLARHRGPPVGPGLLALLPPRGRHPDPEATVVPFAQIAGG